MIKYDKLKNIKTEEEFFSFKCGNCGADGLRKGNFSLTPVGISWKPDMIDNSAIKNEVIRDGLNSLPTLWDAIIIAANGEGNKCVNIKCNCCNRMVGNYNKFNMSDVKKWRSKNLKEYLDLRLVR